MGAQAKAVERPSTPRFTWDGCPCMQRWRLIGFEGVHVSNYCGNPDNDPGGEWCFVVDSACQPRINWGFCAPAPRCSIGSDVRVPWMHWQQRPGQLEDYRGLLVVVRWSNGSADSIDARQVTTQHGLPCIHRRPSASTSRPSSQRLATRTSTTTASVDRILTSSIQVTTTPSRPALRSTRTVTQHQELSTTTRSTTVFVAVPLLHQQQQPVVIGMTTSNHRQRFDTSKHGHALALRLDWDFGTFQLNWMRQQAVVEAAILDAAAAAVQQPKEVVEVLAIMRGSVIVALGVVPTDCQTGDPFRDACKRALLMVRQRWEVALWDPTSPLRRLLGNVDPMFPALLDYTECSRRGLLCPWIAANSGGQTGCSSFCQKARVKTNAEHDPWWFLSLIAFASAAPTCLCCGLLMLKVLFRLWHYLRHRRHLREVRANASALPRVELRLEELPVSEDWACSICLGELTVEGDLLLLPCKHTLHYECAFEWLERRLVCPMCRAPVSLRDCAIYTPSLVVPFDSADAEEECAEPEALPSALPEGQDHSLLLPLPPLPHAVVDEDI